MNILHVTTEGSQVVRKEGNLAVKRGEEVLLFPLEKIGGVVLHPGTSITEPALRILLKKRATVLHLGRNGRLVGISHSPDARPDLSKLRAQLGLRERPRQRVRLARQILWGKLSSQAAYLDLRARWAAKQRSAAPYFEEAAERIRALRERLASAEELRILRGLEGLASRLYFKALSEFLGSRDVVFPGRRFRPPKDVANAALSYGYGILRAYVTTAVLQAKLLPRPGILHEDDLHNHATLVYDLMEEFRVPAVDMVVVKLLLNHQLSNRVAKQEHGAVFLNEEGRKRLSAALVRRMQRVFVHPGLNKEGTLIEHIFEQAGRLGRAMVRDEHYIPFYLTEGGV